MLFMKINWSDGAGVVRGAQEVVVHWYWPPRMPAMRVDPLG